MFVSKITVYIGRVGWCVLRVMDSKGLEILISLSSFFSVSPFGSFQVLRREISVLFFLITPLMTVFSQVSFSFFKFVFLP